MKFELITKTWDIEGKFVDGDKYATLTEQKYREMHRSKDSLVKHYINTNYDKLPGLLYLFRHMVNNEHKTLLSMGGENVYLNIYSKAGYRRG